jgi:hypothetical protein
MITGMMIPEICDGCNLRFFKADLIGTKYGQQKYFNRPLESETLSVPKAN